MNKNQSKFVIVVIVMLSVFLVFASVFLSSHSPVGTVYPSVDLNLDNVTVWCIGNYNGVGSVLVPMQQLGAQTKILDMELSNYTVLDFNSYSVILFDSDWLCKQKENSDVYDLISKSIASGTKLISVGNRTSVFFQFLDNAEIHVLGYDQNGNVRNPAQNEPLIVGYTLKQRIEPNGEVYYYPSIFTSNLNEVNGNLEGLLSWIRG